MNGLEAVALMHEGKTARLVDSDLIYCIQNGTVMSKIISSEKWVKNLHFDFQADYEEYIEPKELTGWERVEGGAYNAISKYGVVNLIDMGYHNDSNRYKNANYFSTKEKVEEINFKQTLFRKLQRFSDENGGNEIDTNENKFFIYYNFETKTPDVWSYQKTSCFGQVYFISREIAEKAIELFHDDLIKYFTGDFGGKS